MSCLPVLHLGALLRKPCSRPRAPGRVAEYSTCTLTKKLTKARDTRSRLVDDLGHMVHASLCSTLCHSSPPPPIAYDAASSSSPAVAAFTCKFLVLHPGQGVLSFSQLRGTAHNDHLQARTAAIQRHIRRHPRAALVAQDQARCVRKSSRLLARAGDRDEGSSSLIQSLRPLSQNMSSRELRAHGSGAHPFLHADSSVLTASPATTTPTFSAPAATRVSAVPKGLAVCR